MERYWTEEFRLADKFVTYQLRDFLKEPENRRKTHGLRGFDKFQVLTVELPRLWCGDQREARVNALIQVLTDYYHDVGYSIAQRQADRKTLLDRDWDKLIATYEALLPHLDKREDRNFLKVLDDLIPVARAEKGSRLRAWIAWRRYRWKNFRHPIK